MKYYCPECGKEFNLENAEDKHCYCGGLLRSCQTGEDIQ